MVQPVRRVVWFVHWVPFSILEDSLIAKEISRKVFLLKGYSATSLFLGQRSILVSSPHWDIHIIPDCFPCLPSGNLTPSSQP